MREVRAAAWLLLLVTAVPGCVRRTRSSDPVVAFDAELVDSDPGSFHQRFDGSAGKVSLGTGWYGLEQIEKTGPWSGFSWAARTANVYFGIPASHDVELVARVAPFTYPGARPQTLTPSLNGTSLPGVALAADWQEVRVPLPDNLLRAPLNELRLTFAYSAVPSRVTGSTDPRELAAVVADLSVVPRGRPPSAPQSSVGRGGNRREVALRGEGVAIPLPSGPRYRLRVGAVRSPEPRASISIDFWRAGSRKTLWKGSPAALSGSTLDLDVGNVAPAGMLLLRAQTDGGLLLRSGASVDLELTAPEVSTAANAPPHPERPDIFLYVIDTLRADALGTYGGRAPTSPRIDAFARDAVTYERAWSASSWTLPATASILSGVYPFEHDMAEASERLPEEGVPWMPELLGRSGYETVAVSQWPLGKSFGFERGFGTYTLDVRLMKKSRSELARGLFWQYLFNRPKPERPLFAYVHASDPHAVYEPPGEEHLFADRQPGTLPPQLYNPQVFLSEGFGRNPADTAHLRALYDGEVLHADRQFGAFLDTLRYLGLYDHSLIILVSDHGEEFYEHGGFDHGRTLYEELLHVPLIVRYPDGRGAGARIAGRVSTLDLPPTILGILGPYTGLGLHGRPLPRSPETADSARRLFAQVRVGGSSLQGPVDLSALVEGDIKCVFSALEEDRFHRKAPRLEVYDLAVDPGEHTPLATGDARARSCSAGLEQWLARVRAAAHRPKRSREELPPEEIRRLRALGYIQ